MEDDRSWLQKLCANIVCQGPMPQHVGLILDGNRRYAKKSGLKTIEGHIEGFQQLKRTLRWGWYLGVKEVTAYIFSIENFKRPKEEVDALMELAAEKMQVLFENEDKIMKYGICIQIVGDWSLFPSHLKKGIYEIMLKTRYNTTAKINLAFAYTARNEIARGVESIHWGTKNGRLLSEDVDEHLLSECLHIVPSRPLDLIIRTSGESRLSDFLLWQSSESILSFIDALWPEMTFWTLLSAVFQYQVNYLSMKKIKRPEKHVVDSEVETRQQKFIEKMRNLKFKYLENETRSN